MITHFFYSIITLRSGKAKVAKEEFYGVKKRLNIWGVNVDNIIISKLVKTKSNSKYLIGYLDNVLRPLVLRPFKVNGRDKDKKNKFMSFHMDAEKLLEKIKSHLYED